MPESKELVFLSKRCKYSICKSETIESYLENDINLKNQEGKCIEKFEFDKIIMLEVNNFINPFDNIVVLAGAGASIVLGENGEPNKNYGHTVNMISEDIKNELNNNDFYSIQELAEFCKYKLTVNNHEKEDEFSYNLEDLLSKIITYEEFIDDNKGIDLEKYKKSKNKILEIIRRKTSYSYNKEIHEHGSFIKKLSNLHKSPNRLTIATTNYDTLFEEAASSLNFTVFDGFSFDYNPVFDIDLFDWSLVKPILNVKSEKMQFKKSTINLLKIHGSLTWEEKDDNIVRVSKDENINPIMIFPSSNKYTHSYEKPYFELFSKFQEYIKKPNTLLITTGFSFADNHISKMITQAIKTTPSLTVLITDHSIDSENKCNNWKELEILMRNGYRIAFLRGTIDGKLADYFGDRSDDN